MVKEKKFSFCHFLVLENPPHSLLLFVIFNLCVCVLVLFYTSRKSRKVCRSCRVFRFFFLLFASSAASRNAKSEKWRKQNLLQSCYFSFSFFVFLSFRIRLNVYSILSHSSFVVVNWACVSFRLDLIWLFYFHVRKKFKKKKTENEILLFVWTEPKI